MPRPGPRGPRQRRYVSVPRRALRGHAPESGGGASSTGRGFSAPKGVERACPPRAGPQQGAHPATVSVPRRALRGHAPWLCAWWESFVVVSVPRRALRGHAPPPGARTRVPGSSFSAPKGVERACPCLMRRRCPDSAHCFSAPKGVERACPTHRWERAERGLSFQCPEGR